MAYSSDDGEVAAGRDAEDDEEDEEVDFSKLDSLKSRKQPANDDDDDDESSSGSGDDEQDEEEVPPNDYDDDDDDDDDAEKVDDLADQQPAAALEPDPELVALFQIQDGDEPLDLNAFILLAGAGSLAPVPPGQRVMETLRRMWSYRSH